MSLIQLEKWIFMITLGICSYEFCWLETGRRLTVSDLTELHAIFALLFALRILLGSRVEN